MTRVIRNLGIIALLPLFGLVFWVAATVASSLLGLDVIGVNVHGPGLASYAGGLYVRPAPLSAQIGLDAQQDASGNRATTVTTNPTPTTAPAKPSPVPTRPAYPTPTPLPVPTPTPLPLPVATPTPLPLPLPTPTPGPLPVPTPTPTPTPILPLPLPSILPVPSILPSLLPGLIK
jgi:hypothetical protein